MSALPSHPLHPRLTVQELDAIAHRHANQEAELDAYRAEVERLQIALNQIERNALNGQTMKGDLSSITSHVVCTLDNIARIAQENSNRQPPYVRINIGPAKATKTPTMELMRNLIDPTFAEMKAALERHQQREGRALQECERMKTALERIAKEAECARQPDCQCMNGRCRECYAALGVIRDWAEFAACENGVPF